MTKISSKITLRANGNTFAWHTRGSDTSRAGWTLLALLECRRLDLTLPDGAVQAYGCTSPTLLTELVQHIHDAGDGALSIRLVEGKHTLCAEVPTRAEARAIIRSFRETGVGTILEARS